MSQDFIIQIRLALAKHRKSQAWLAKQVGISAAYMSDIMNGKRSPESMTTPIKVVLKELDKEELVNNERI